MGVIELPSDHYDEKRSRDKLKNKLILALTKLRKWWKITKQLKKMRRLTQGMMEWRLKKLQEVEEEQELESE